MRLRGSSGRRSKLSGVVCEAPDGLDGLAGLRYVNDDENDDDDDDDERTGDGSGGAVPVRQ